jgi:hypothetical protein
MRASLARNGDCLCLTYDAAASVSRVRLLAPQ